jgi:hypothetical protein
VGLRCEMPHQAEHLMLFACSQARWATTAPKTRCRDLASRPRPVTTHRAQPSKPGPSVIIVSVSRNDATSPYDSIHTDARSRSSTATQQHSQAHTRARPISVHTKSTHRISAPSTVPGIVLRRLTGIKGGLTAVADVMAQAPPLTPASQRRGSRV